MTTYYESKHNFTAGEVSPFMYGRRDFDRYKNGCKRLRNMVVLTQGPVTRRSGLEFLYDLTSLGLDTTDPKVRTEDFIFNELQAYVLVFFKHTSGVIRLVFATGSGLVVYPDPPTGECPPGTPVTPTPGDVVALDMPTGWDIDTFDYAQSGDYFYVAQSGLAPHAIIRHASDCWEVTALTFTDQPSEWSDVNGWPETVTFFQQRLAFGGSTAYRQTIWTSRAGDFTHFGQAGATLVDSDAVAFTLDSGTQNKIQWLTTVKYLYAGTIGNEWVITGNGQSTITPSSVYTNSPTNQGSEKIRPLRIGLTTLFVERHGRVVNEFVFDYNFDGYKTSDITVLAPHLTEDYSVVGWAYQQTPGSVVWQVRGDGALLGLTYQRQHNVVGWHVHDTDGLFKCVSCIPGSDREDDLFVVVKRVIEGADKYYLEKMAPRFKGPDAKDGRFLDSFVTYDGVATDTLTGLDHLEGEEVYVVGDGAVFPPVTVSGGAVTLEFEVSEAMIGLYYSSEVWPLMDEIKTREGTSVTRDQRVLNISVELYESLYFELGTVDEDGNEFVETPAFRSPEDTTGEPVPLFSGVKKVNFVLGHNNSSSYFIRQKLPLPLTVVSAVDFIEVN